MPKVNPMRTVQHERNVARRVQLEREARRWSYESLAERMTRAGYPVAASGLYKLENGDPPRRVTVDELVGFSRVFKIDVTDMLVPVERARDKRIDSLAKVIEDELSEIVSTIDSIVWREVGLVQNLGDLGDRAVLRRLNELVTAPAASYPMADEGTRRTRDPIGDAWAKLVEALHAHARWYAANEEQ